MSFVDSQQKKYNSNEPTIQATIAINYYCVHQHDACLLHLLLTMNFYQVTINKRNW